MPQTRRSSWRPVGKGICLPWTGLHPETRTAQLEYPSSVAVPCV